MVHPGGPRRLGGFPLPPPPAPLKQHCKMQKLSPSRAPPRHFGRAGRRLHLAPAAPPPGPRGPRRLQARAAAAEALAHAPPAVQAPSRAAGGAGGRAYERAHTQRGPATAAHPPPAWRAEKAGPAAGRARSAARLAALVQRGKPKYQFQTLGKHSAPRAARMRSATPLPPPPGGGPAPTAFTPLTVPGRGAAGPRRPARARAWPVTVAEGPGSRRGQARGSAGQGRPATRNFTRSLALGGGPTGRSRTPARHGGEVARSSKDTPGPDEPPHRRSPDRTTQNAATIHRAELHSPRPRAPYK